MLLSREDVDDKDDENEHEADEGHNDHNDIAPANFHSCKIRYFEKRPVPGVTQNIWLKSSDSFGKS